jgi:hypothetical protein
MGIFDRAKSARPDRELVEIERMARNHPDPAARRIANREADRQAALVVGEATAEGNEQDQHAKRKGR